MQVNKEWDRIDEYFVRANKYLVTALIPMMFVLYIWAPEIFRIWIGQEMSLQVSSPFRMLIFGFAVGLLAPLSGTLLEAIGRPDILVKLYVVEVPFNIATVVALVKLYGVQGAAISYTIRTVLETVLLWLILYRLVPLSGLRLLKAALLRPSIPLILFGFGAYFLSGARTDNCYDILSTLLICIAYVPFVLRFVFDSRDRQFLWSLCANRKADFTCVLRNPLNSL